MFYQYFMCLSMYVRLTHTIKITYLLTYLLLWVFRHLSGAWGHCQAVVIGLCVDYVQRSSSSLYRRLRYRNCLNYITLRWAGSMLIMSKCVLLHPTEAIHSKISTRLPTQAGAKCSNVVLKMWNLVNVKTLPYCDHSFTQPEHSPEGPC